ncbi:MAG: glutamate synthase, partial [SAR324 cluster bacterium]|nr:glutamate synthase [SAR324 cluster bacterium]
FPQSEKVMYLSGTPLHVLGIHLVQQFREKFGDQFPISFSAGIDKTNFADAVALGLTPITVCSDLLKVGGYSRSSTYYKELNSRMDNLGVRDIESYLLKAYGNAEQALGNIGFGNGNISGKETAAVDALRKTLENGGELRKVAGAEEAPLANEIFEKWLSEVILLNTKTYVDEVTTQARYTLEKNSNPPRKVGTTLELFDCLTCDKCIPVCPNDANFTLKIPQGETEILEFENNKSGWSVNARSSLKLAKKYQIANFADFCNECGNCDIFCPEDGGPFLLKPRFFGSRETFQEFSYRDGFYIERVETDDQASTVFSRFDGKEYRLETKGSLIRYSGPDFEVQFSRDDPENTISGEAKNRVSFLNYEIMNMMRASYENTARLAPTTD